MDRAGAVGTGPARWDPGSAGRPGRSLAWALPAVLALTLSACSLHVSSHGVSGNVFGHSFSAAKGALPSGFPSGVPVPDHSRVLGGGGTENNWDAAFAVTGSIAAGAAAYQAKFESAGYTISDVRSGTTPVTGAASERHVDHGDPDRIGLHRQERPMGGGGGIRHHLHHQGKSTEVR